MIYICCQIIAFRLSFSYKKINVYKSVISREYFQLYKNTLKMFEENLINIYNDSII
jgi:hypothetical protein